MIPGKISGRKDFRMKQALILFTRVPTEGKTKTRLQTALTPAQCVEAHCAFLRDAKAACSNPSQWDLLVFYGDEGPLSVLQKILPEQSAFFPQQGKSLGEKMDRAISRVLSMGYERCVLVGADLPELNQKIIDAAMQQLQKNQLVLGPTADGGYYLIGSTKPCPEIFSGQSYGGSSVFENTVAAAKKAGLSLGIVAPLEDIDQPEDLRALAKRLNGKQETVCPHSRQFLRKLGWM